jgi:hypothetical protein
VRQLSQKWGKRVLLNLGYLNVDGGNHRPWTGGTGTLDPQEQADCWEAAFRVWGSEGIAGFSMENYNLQQRNLLSQDFRGKLAETVIANKLTEIIGAPESYLLTVNAQVNSSILENVSFMLDGTQQQTPYSNQASVGEHVITATSTIVVSNQAYTFERWGDGVTTNSRSVSIDTPINLTILYRSTTQNVVSITIAVSGEGKVDKPLGINSYNIGDSLTITATPNAGSLFKQWQFNGVIYANNPLEIIIAEDMNGKTLTGEFQIISPTPIIPTALPIILGYAGSLTYLIWRIAK